MPSTRASPPAGSPRARPRPLPRPAAPAPPRPWSEPSASAPPRCCMLRLKRAATFRSPSAVNLCRSTACERWVPWRSPCTPGISPRRAASASPSRTSRPSICWRKHFCWSRAWAVTLDVGRAGRGLRPDDKPLSLGGSCGHGPGRAAGENAADDEFARPSRAGGPGVGRRTVAPCRYSLVQRSGRRDAVVIAGCGLQVCRAGHGDRDRESVGRRAHGLGERDRRGRYPAGRSKGAGLDHPIAAGAGVVTVTGWDCAEWLLPSTASTV
jgi:hypothetical protein